MSKHDPTTHGSVSGDTVAERMAFWRALTWEELVSYMSCAEGDRLPRADRLTAPGVVARVRRERLN